MRLIVTLALAAMAWIITTQPSISLKSNVHAREVKVLTLNMTQMPVKIIAATAENRSDDSWLKYSLRNISTEQVRQVTVRVFIVDSQGRLLKSEESSGAEPLAALKTHDDRALIESTINEPGRSIVAVTKVVGASGVWKVDPPSLQKAVIAKLEGTTETDVTVIYNPHVLVSIDDKSQILGLIIEDILHDQKKARFLGGPSSRLIVSRESVDFTLPQISGTSLVALNADNIQSIADQEGSLVFLTLEPIVVEGSSIIVRIVLKDEVARQPGIHIPYRYTFLFECVKENGRWLIKESSGYA